MSKRRFNVNLPTEIVQEIQRAFLESAGSTHGAMQKGLARGAELVVDELRAGGAQLPESADSENLYLKLPKEQIRDFDVRIAELGMKRPQALAEAVLLWLKYSNEEKINGVDFNENKSYYSQRAQKAIQKSSEAIRLIEESISELRAWASGEEQQQDGDRQSTLDELIDDALQKTANVAKQAAELKEELQGGQVRHRRRK